MRPDDLERWASIWNQRVGAVFPRPLAIEQSLWELVREKETVEVVLAGRMPLPAGRLHHFVRDPSAARALVRPRAGLRAPAGGAHGPMRPWDGEGSAGVPQLRRGPGSHGPAAARDTLDGDAVGEHPVRPPLEALVVRRIPARFVRVHCSGVVSLECSASAG